MEDEDPYRRDGPSPARSKVKVAMSRGAAGASDRLAHNKSRTKSPRNTEIGRLSRLRMPRAIMRTSFKVKRSSSITAEAKSVSIYRTGRLRNFKTGTRIEHALPTATASYKGL